MTAAALEVPLKRRYTVDGSESLEDLLRRTCERVLTGVQSIVPARRLQGLLLAGGYGRGEGGVLHTPEGDQPYNDLDFYVFVRGNPLLSMRNLKGPLHHLSETLSKEVGIEIELKGDSLARWRGLPVTMFSYDVVMGHKWISGDESMFNGCEHHRDATAIPAAEAARLLLNRCSGLLFAAEQLQRKEFTPESADFVARNIAKAQLALGDAVLAMYRQYHWSCLERHERLNALSGTFPGGRELRAHHAAGVEFKLHPTRSPQPRHELQCVHDKISALAQEMWLWLESQRLGRSYRSVLDYSSDSVNKCPETAAWRNCLVNLRSFKQCSWRYPRERLYRALPLLLWEPEHFNEELLHPVVSQHRDFSSCVNAYRALWQRFS